MLKFDEAINEKKTKEHHGTNRSISKAKGAENVIFEICEIKRESLHAQMVIFIFDLRQKRFLFTHFVALIDSRIITFMNKPFSFA